MAVASLSDLSAGELFRPIDTVAFAPIGPVQHRLEPGEHAALPMRLAVDRPDELPPGAELEVEVVVGRFDLMLGGGRSRVVEA